MPLPKNSLLKQYDIKNTFIYKAQGFQVTLDYTLIKRGLELIIITKDLLQIRTKNGQFYKKNGYNK